MSKVKFDDNYFMTPSEAAHRWVMKRNTIIAALTRGRFNECLEEGLVRKFTLHGSTEWSISAKAMRQVYGDEDKVQVFELWKQVGSEGSNPDFSIHFKGRPLKVFKNVQEIPNELLDQLKEIEDYNSARELVKQWS